MSNLVIHSTGKLNDAQIVELMSEIADKFGVFDLRYKYGLFQIDEEDVEAVFANSDGYALTESDLQTTDTKFHVWYKRGTTGRNRNGETDHNVRIASPYYDEVIVVAGPAAEEPTAREIKDLEKLIAQHIFRRVPTAGAKGEETAVDVLQAELAQVASTHAKMLKDAAKLRHQTEQDRIAQLKEVSDEAKRLRDEHQAHVDAETERLNEREEAIESERKTLDDRHHMHARRALREDINTDLHSRMNTAIQPFQLTVTSYLISCLSLIGVAMSSYIAFHSFEGFQGVLTASAAEKAGISSVGYLMGAEFIRGVLASLGAVGLLLYTISWMRRTYLDQVKQRQELQKYFLDINRASWAIETILEVTEREGRQLPDRWVEGACHGLFQTNEQEHAEITPMEAWTALLSGSAKVQHGPNGTLLEMSGKDAKKMAKKQDAK